MMTRSTRFSVGAALFALLALLPISAFASKPVVQTFPPFQYEDVLAECDGYQIVASGTVETTRTDFYDQDGNLIGTHLQVRVDGVLTNTGTGETFKDDANLTTFVDYAENTRTRVGILVKNVVPGVGVVVRDLGTITFDRATGEILFETGPHQVIHGDDVDFCVVFA